MKFQGFFPFIGLDYCQIIEIDKNFDFYGFWLSYVHLPSPT